MLAAPAVAPGDGWGISVNPNLVKPNLVKPHFGENSHRIEINLVRILTELAFQFYRVFSSFFFQFGEFCEFGENSHRIGNLNRCGSPKSAHFGELCCRGSLGR